MDPHHLNVWSHIGTGALALLIGLVPLFSRKGGPLHRWSGRTTVGLGAVVLTSAVIAEAAEPFLSRVGRKGFRLPLR